MSTEIKLEIDHYSGANAILLTTERAESSHGMPVAVLVGGKNNGLALGPGDIIPDVDGHAELTWMKEPARALVADFANRNGQRGNNLVEKFLLL